VAVTPLPYPTSEFFDRRNFQKPFPRSGRNWRAFRLCALTKKQFIQKQKLPQLICAGQLELSNSPLIKKITCFSKAC
jgi:hypothetical protein